jgi:hypothetical protein
MNAIIAMIVTAGLFALTAMLATRREPEAGCGESCEGCEVAHAVADAPDGTSCALSLSAQADRTRLTRSASEPRHGHR